jgi:hypothetical protein
MKGSEPPINKRFRRIYFSMKNKAVYKTYLIRGMNSELFSRENIMQWMPL